MRAIRAMLAAVALVGVTSGAAVVPASATDYHNWGGLYIGANAGWVSTDFDWAFSPAIPGAPNQSYSFGEDSGIVGGHIGFQHQMNHLLIGVEAAYSGSGVFGDDWASRERFGVGSADSLARMGGIFTVGPRLGWVPNSRWLLFVGGGYANASIRTAGRIPATGAFIQEASGRHDGWYLGGGVEHALTQNIILGVEYQHIGFDTEHHCSSQPCDVNTNNRNIDADVDIVRARLSFKLGRREADPKSMK